MPVDVAIRGAAAVSAAHAYWGALMGGVYESASPQWPDSPADYSSSWETWNSFIAKAGSKALTLQHMAVASSAPWAGGPVFTDATLRAEMDGVRARGAIPIYSVSTGTTPLKNYASGTYDAGTTGIDQWFTDMAAWGHPFILRWDWEMNGSWFSHSPGNSTQIAASGTIAQAQLDYNAAWQHAHDRCVAQGATNVTWFWCPNTPDTLTGPLATDLTKYSPLDKIYPGDSYVDVVGGDGYNWDTVKFPNWQTPVQVFDNLKSALAGGTIPNTGVISAGIASKPAIIGEVGCHEPYGGPVRTAGGASSVSNPQNKADWITNLFTVYVPAWSQLKGVAWYNRPDQNPSLTTGAQWAIDTTPQSKAAFAAAVAGSYFADTLPTMSDLAKVVFPS